MQQQVSYGLQHTQYGVELIDAHCHLELFDDYTVAVSDARMAGVRWMVTAGGTKASSLAAERIADGISVFAVIGVDPSAPADDASFVEEIKSVVGSNKNIVGIGEVGLDYKLAEVNRDYQKKLFSRQLEIAAEINMPVVVHARGAIADAMEMIAERGDVRCMMHFFEGDEKQAERLAGDGHLISIPPIESSRRKRVINAVGLSNIAVETDSPVVGKSPIDVIRTVGWIAQIKGVSFNDAATRITQNVKKLFSI